MPTGDQTNAMDQRNFKLIHALVYTGFLYALMTTSLQNTVPSPGPPCLVDLSRAKPAPTPCGFQR